MSLTVGPLRGGGFVPWWRCGSRCRHCLYGCGPHRRDGSVEGAPAREKVLDRLAERGGKARWHLGGGEPFLQPDALAAWIGGMVSRGLPLEYVETNASWVQDRAHAEQVLGDLAERGLACLLVSLSPFHAEYVPFARTRALIEAAQRVLPAGAFVWIPDFVPDVAGAPSERPLDLGALLAEKGDDYALELAARYGLVAGGRAGRFRAAHGDRRRWEDVAAEAPCRSRLADTSHFHVDAAGNYLPGLCAGIALRWEEVPGTVDLGRYPVLRALLGPDGLAGLVAAACDHGFVPLAAGYSDPCDLCTHVRLHLFIRDAGTHPELGPAGFYEPASLPGYATTPA